MLIFISLQRFFKLFLTNFVSHNMKIYSNNHYSKLHPMILFLSHINCSATNTIQNVFINLRAIKAHVISTLPLLQKLTNVTLVTSVTLSALCSGVLLPFNLFVPWCKMTVSCRKFLVNII